MTDGELTVSKSCGESLPVRANAVGIPRFTNQKCLAAYHGNVVICNIKHIVGGIPADTTIMTSCDDSRAKGRTG